MLRVCDRLKVSVGPWNHYGEVPKWWINRALIADRVEAEAAEFHELEQLRRMVG